MRTGSFLSLSGHAFHRVAFTDWGDNANARVLICVHGLTRNGRDFDFLASVLQREYRVLCPDMVGRGRSDWLTIKQDYNYPTYCADMATLMAWLRTEAVDWVGTSMGGIIGMLLAAQPNTPIRRLVLNDIGPFIPKPALERIASYVGADPRFDRMDDVETYLRRIHAGFGPLTDEQWAHLARHSAKPTTDGYALVYDPGIAHSFHSAPLQDIDLWAVWDQIRCPVLAIRGGDSDVLLADTAAQMQCRGPQTELVEIAAVGHAPALLAADQIAIVRDWLLNQG
jgi:pimeloyl-ACP methyl ester carboxylesterase